MPAYHSSFNALAEVRTVGNIALLPIKSKTRGPAPQAPTTQEDIIDETLTLFRANCLFRNFDIQGPADRLLIYLILFTSDCLIKIGSTRTPPGANEAYKTLQTLAVDNVVLPGDMTFSLNALYQAPRDRTDADLLRSYLIQCRIELATRLVERLYQDGTGRPSKWWMCFQKRRFMGKTLSS